MKFKNAKISAPDNPNVEPDTRIMSSQAWNQIFKWRILDPDGWDRKNFEYSWYQEQITREEFIRRTNQSTVYNREPLIDEVGVIDCKALKDIYPSPIPQPEEEL